MESMNSRSAAGAAVGGVSGWNGWTVHPGGRQHCLQVEPVMRITAAALAFGMPPPGVPIAETTTILFFAGSSSISFAAFLMRSAEPTQVPPNLSRQTQRQLSKKPKNRLAVTAESSRAEGFALPHAQLTCESPRTSRAGSRPCRLRLRGMRSGWAWRWWRG